MTMKITKEIIDSAGKTCIDCPVTRTLSRAFPSLIFYVHSRYVVIHNISLSQEFKVQRILLPPEVTKFIIQYDSKKPVKPFEFELNIDLKYFYPGA